jgi:uncharacterized protein
VRAEERLQSLDIMRGLALLGVVLVNMPYYNTPPFALFARIGQWTAPADRTVELALRFLLQGKIYGMLAFLLGVGIAVQLGRAEAAGVRFRPLYLRRMLVLLLFGIVHVVLLWFGDVLILFSVLGLLLIPLLRRTPKTILIWAVGLLLLPLAMNVTFLILQPPPGPAAATGFEERMAHARQVIEAARHTYAAGGFGEILRQRIGDWLFFNSFVFMAAPAIMGLLLLGFYAGRRRLLHHLAENRLLLRRLMLWGGVIGVVGNGIYFYTRETIDPATASKALALLSGAAFTFGTPALTLCYIAATLWLVHRKEWRRRLAPVAAVGQMSLSNYLLQSLICTTLYYGYGFGLFGRVRPLAGLGIALVIYLAELGFSNGWLRRFRFGPAEWLWRSLVYWRPQPMLAPGRAAAAPSLAS